jgi:transcription initiation factor TFIID subunit 5
MSQSSSSLYPSKVCADTIRRQVIEYLIKKGYNRTEQTLRQESANLDRDGKPIHDRVEEEGNVKYSKAFTLLSNWIEQNLDIYKVGLLFKVKSPH